MLTFGVNHQDLVVGENDAARVYCKFNYSGSLTTLVGAGSPRKVDKSYFPNFLKNAFINQQCFSVVDVLYKLTAQLFEIQ